MADSPFKTYEVTRVDTRTIATITEENINQIAAIIKGKVDYSGDRPVLIESDSDSSMAWWIGMVVSFGGQYLTNESDFLTGSDVTNVREVPDDQH